MNKVLLGTLCILFMLPLAASAAIIGENCPSPIDRSKVPPFPEPMEPVNTPQAVPVAQSTPSPP